MNPPVETWRTRSCHFRILDTDYVHSERAASKLQLFCDLCDLTSPASSLGWVNFDDGIVGLAGTTSSLIGIYNQWRKTA